MYKYNFDTIVHITFVFCTKSSFPNELYNCNFLKIQDCNKKVNIENFKTLSG